MLKTKTMTTWQDVTIDGVAYGTGKIEYRSVPGSVGRDGLKFQCRRLVVDLDTPIGLMGTDPAVCPDVSATAEAIEAIERTQNLIEWSEVFHAIQHKLSDVSLSIDFDAFLSVARARRRQLEWDAELAGIWSSRKLWTFVVIVFLIFWIGSAWWLTWQNG